MDPKAGLVTVGKENSLASAGIRTRISSTQLPKVSILSVYTFLSLWG
jgi:hypothetical protein